VSGGERSTILRPDPDLIDVAGSIKKIAVTADKPYERFSAINIE